MTAATVSLQVPLLTSVITALAASKAESPSQPEIADEVLFEDAVSGNSDALGVLISRYERPLFAMLARMTNGDTHRADDLFQETFLHAMKSGGTFNRKLNFKPWIMAIAVNLVRDDARKRKVRGEVALDGGSEDGESGRLPEPASLDEGPGALAERRDDEQTVQRALARLTSIEREVVLLHFFNRMTLLETAQTLQVPLGTAKSRLHAALIRLATMLKRPE